MKKQIIHTIYDTISYLRLSDDDGDNRESDSISNQRILLDGYMKGKPELVKVRECVDDGYTGTNFNRPGFQEMMRLVESGKANCIIAKDLSRFGRDFSGVLQYVERTLPQMGVRLILVNDNYDSISPDHDFITLRLKSFINDIYPADTSRSIRANLRAKMAAGQCVAPFCFLWFPEIAGGQA
ncbi:MAG: recombinase family protein [Frisingicoccus sp.]